MTKRIAQDARGSFWVIGEGITSYPVRLELCPACGAVVADSYWHTNWHEELEKPL